MAKWVIDPDHSVAIFAVKHFMINDVRGQLNQLSGEVIFDADENLATSFSVDVGVTSLFTGVKKRDEDLFSPNFFDVARFPTMSFRSETVEPTAWNSFRVEGIITIRGLSREIILDGEFSGPVQGPKELGGEICMGFVLSGRLRHKEFGLAWNHPMEKHGMVVGPETRLWVYLEADRA